MKKMVRILYTEYGEEKVFTFTYTPKNVIPEIERVFTKEITIDGNYRFMSSASKYLVKISTYTTQNELAILYKLSHSLLGTIHYEIDTEVFEGRVPKNRISGRLNVISAIPPQKPNHTLYKVECEIYEA